MSKESFKDIWSLRKPGARDSARHKERVREAIKDNLRDLIAEENIITSHGNKKIKVPIKYLDMWRFKFGKNKKSNSVGQGEGKEPGDIIAKEGGKPGQGDKAGEQAGEDIYEEEVDLDEVIEIMLEDLDLPWLEEKDKAIEVETEEIVFQDIAEKGLPANIDKRRTILQNMKRNAMKGKMRIKGIALEDLRYKVWEKVVEKHSNAAVFLLMDRSGSMDSEKKYIVKSFFFWMVNFIRRKYNNVEIVFIAHDTRAKEVEEDKFFEISQSGGTKCSSALQLAKDIIEERYPDNIWNNYVYSFSDGDNWSDDNSICVDLVKDLLKVCQAVGYGEVHYNNWFYNWSQNNQDRIEDYKKSKLAYSYDSNLDLVTNPRFMIGVISKREDIYQCLRNFLKGVNSNE